jgi:hypothetical protein
LKNTTIQKCDIGLHQSLACFPWSNYPKGFFAHIVFLTPKNELLLVPDGQDGWVLPSESVRGGYVLLNSPIRVCDDTLGGEQYCRFNHGVGRQNRIVGQFEKEGSFNVVVSAPILRPVQKQWRYVVGCEKMAELVEPDSVAFMVAEVLAERRMPGWVMNKETMVA